MVEDHIDEIDMIGMSITQFKKVLEFVLNNMVLEFEGSIYHQCKGLGMGTRSSPLSNHHDACHRNTCA